MPGRNLIPSYALVFSTKSGKQKQVQYAYNKKEVRARMRAANRRFVNLSVFKLCKLEKSQHGVKAGVWL